MKAVPLYLPLHAPSRDQTFPAAFGEVTGAGRAEGQLLIEAAKARSFGKTIVAEVLESLARVVSCAPCVRRSIESWPGDIASAGVIFRINAGLHALARSGRDKGLQQIYVAAESGAMPAPDRLDAALLAALDRHTSDLLQWMAGPTQTNEVARVAGFVAALHELDAVCPMPNELLELGASAGLNLNLARYGCELGGISSGDRSSPVQIKPRWQGRTPPASDVVIANAAGVDLNPLDIRDDDDCERLLAYVWPGEHARDNRLRAAIAIARKHPPQVQAGLAGRWLPRQLGVPQREGTRRVVLHSMVVQYMPEVERAAVDAALALAAADATTARPLARIGLEWSADRSIVEVRVTVWDGGPASGRTVVAAHCHPYAEWFDWHGLGSGWPIR